MPELVSAVPDPTVAAAVIDLARAVESTDGAPPLSDQALSHLADGSVRHVVATTDGQAVGYAQRDGDTVEVVALPESLNAVLDEVAEPGLLVWSHGSRSRLIDAFEARGYERIRELHQLRRPFDDAHPLPEDPPLVEGITVRAFVPGEDDAAWLDLNAAAFAHHPEQGRMTQADLDARTAEPWFDPAGFLLAERDGSLVAFHWTKVHPDGLGEVYVLGVSPQAQGLGLGGALLTRGLHHLQGIGCPGVLLYVDGDNPTAVHLYERDGFARFDLDVQWRMT